MIVNFSLRVSIPEGSYLTYSSENDKQTSELLSDEVKKLAKDTKETNIKTEKLQIDILEQKSILIIGFIVLIVMVAQMLVSAFNDKGNASENIVQQLNQQNIQLQRLNDNLENAKK